MGKRTRYERQKRDLYFTPYEAVVPLFRHLPQFGGTFYAPCAADGNLVAFLDWCMVCAGMSDIEPLADSVACIDALRLRPEDLNGADMVIENPPWDRKILHPLIAHFWSLGVPAWLLFDAGWAHTKQAAPFLTHCSAIVSVGRVKWFGGSSGMDDSAWYRFEPEAGQKTIFYGRQAA